MFGAVAVLLALGRLDRVRADAAAGLTTGSQVTENAITHRVTYTRASLTKRGRAASNVS
jgi:hypothetical protein